MDVLSQALGTLAGDAFDLPNGFTNHATMGAEALFALGFGDHVTAWAARHRVPGRAPGPTGRPPDPSDWREALGDVGRIGDWHAFFAHRIGAQGWRDTVAEAVPVLLPGLGTHLFHGLIRTAHAVRALESADASGGDRHRQDELARGLAYWAAWYGTGAGTVGVAQPPPPAVRRSGSVGTDPVPEAVLGLAGAAARSFLEEPGIMSLHGVTAPAAFLLLAAHLPDGAAGLAAAAFVRTHGVLFREPAPSVPVPDADPDALDLAPLAGARDAHPVKLVEASLRLARLSGDPAFVACAQRMVG